MTARICELLAEHGGIIRTADVVAAGIPKETFYQFARDNGLEKVAHGIYMAADCWADVFYLTQAKFPKVIFSHDTALYLHDLAEMEPVPLTVTVDEKYNCSGLTKSGVKVFYTKRDWYTLGTCVMESPGGFQITAYDPERTICDIIRKRGTMDVTAFNYALREYVKRKDRNLGRLSDYAKELHMQKQLWDAMGVLL